MFPGGGPGSYQQGDGWQQPGQPGFPQSAPPGYPQSAPPGNYGQPGYQQPGYPAYPPQQPGYTAGFVPPPPPQSPLRKHLGIIVAFALVAMLSVVGVAAIVLVSSDDKPGDDPNVAGGSSGASTASPSGSSSSKPPAAEPGDGLVVGTGPVRVDVYVDYQCPPCSTFEDATADALTGYVSSNRVTLAIHPVAFIDHRSKNKYATRAAAAVACAHDAGKLLEFHSQLLRNQPAEDTEGPTDSDFVRAGAALGMGSDFASCVTGQQKLTWVRQATAAAQGDGVSSVPAAYVNDREIDTTESALVTAVTSAR